MRDYSLAERKLVYRVLQSHLAEYPELMDSRFLEELQTDLHRTAQAEGIDVTDHQAWDRWLGNQPVACDVRAAKRFLIE